MKRKIYFIVPLLVVAICAACLTGCGKSTINVTISDAMTDTLLTIGSGATVRQALEEAEITLGEGDEISPTAETVLKGGEVITVSRRAVASVEYDGEVKTLTLVGATVAQAIEKSGFTLGKSYAVNYDEGAFLSDGMEIVITRLINVTLTAYGKVQTVPSPSCTVGEFLAAQGITLGKDDIVTPSTNKKMTKDTKIVVKRITIKTITENEVIEFKTVYKSSPSMKKGTSKVTQQGVNGEKKVKYRVTYTDGKETSREVLEEEILRKPTDKIVLQGEKKEATSSGKHIVSKQRVDDCDGSGHGYFIITWSDGTVTYEEY